MTTVSASVIDARANGRTVLSLFEETVAAVPDQVALRWREGEGRGSLTWREYADQAARVAGGLRASGVGPGDRVLLMLRNRPEFHVADIAVLLLGATPISIYNSSSSDQIAYLAGHAGAGVAIVDDAGFLARVEVARAELPDLKGVFLVDGEPTGDVRPWSDLLAAEPVDTTQSAVLNRPDGLATVIYTSGTTGPPKGVQLTHRNVVWTVESYRELVGEITNFRAVSYLPMAHIAERVHSHYLAMASGFEVTTCPEPTEIAAYCREVRPQTMFGVPRVWEKMHAGVLAAMAADPAKEAAFRDAVATALPLQLARRERELTAEEQATLDFLDTAALAGVRGALGLDAVQYAVCGAAPLSTDVLEWFVGIGVPFSEIYGMSENTGPLTWEPWRIRPGTVGRAMPGVEVRLEDDGEVVARGGLVFPGYLDDLEKTAEALDADGWLHTGDIGVLDDDGYLRIVDRKKELIITAGGKNVSPANVEMLLKATSLVGQACVIGDGRPFLSAVLVLDPDVAPVWAAQHGLEGLSLAELAEHPDVVAAVDKAVHDEVNVHLNNVEQVKRFVLTGDDWQQDSDFLTPTAKLKRRGVLAHYGDRIEALYHRA